MVEYGSHKGGKYSGISRRTRRGLRRLGSVCHRVALIGRRSRSAFGFDAAKDRLDEAIGGAFSELEIERWFGRFDLDHLGSVGSGDYVYPCVEESPSTSWNSVERGFCDFD